MPSGYIAPALLERRSTDYNYTELPSGVLVPNTHAPDVEVAAVPNIFVRDIGTQSVILSGTGFTVSAVIGRQPGDELWMFVNHNKGFANPTYEPTGNWTKFSGGSQNGCDMWRRIATGDSNDDFVVDFNAGVIVATKMAAIACSPAAKAAGWDFPSVPMLTRNLYNFNGNTWYIWGSLSQQWMTQDNSKDPYSWVLLNTWQHKSLTGIQNLSLSDAPPYNMDEHIWDFTAYFDGEVLGAMFGVVSFDYEATAVGYQDYIIDYQPFQQNWNRSGVGVRWSLTFTP
jgi:hypothetical protein